MSKLDTVIGRALRDQAFRQQMVANPAAVAAEYGLNKHEVASLNSISQEAADEFFGQVAGGLPPWCSDKKCYERG
jgi:hypothetical protein